MPTLDELNQKYKEIAAVIGDIEVNMKRLEVAKQNQIAKVAELDKQVKELETVATPEAAQSESIGS